MHRRYILIACTLLVAVGAFVATTSVASSSPNPDLSPSLPASSLPKATISESERIALFNLIPADYAASAGITEDSFNNARLLRQTKVGPLYVIPGAAGGVCLTLGSSIGCNDRPTDNTV